MTAEFRVPVDLETFRIAQEAFKTGDYTELHARLQALAVARALARVESVQALRLST